MTPLLRHIMTLAIAATGGALFWLINAPLPWMIGPLVLVGSTALAGLPVAASAASRNAGILVMGVALGLYLTPAAAAKVASYLPAIVVAALATIVLGVLASRALAAMGDVDRTTAFFCSVPGGVAEMSLLGERFGASPPPIALTQLMRIVVVVIVIPSAIIWSGAHGVEPGIHAVLGFDAFGLLGMMALALLVTCGLLAAGLRSAWLLGPMAVGALLGAADANLSSVPPSLSALSQILIGASLGAQFRRDALAGVRRFIPAAMVNAALLGAGSFVIAAALAGITGLPLAALTLATSPGGVTEMCITAEVLELDVPLVVAFHLVRIFIVILATPWVFQALRATGAVEPTEVPAE